MAEKTRTIKQVAKDHPEYFGFPALTGAAANRERVRLTKEAESAPPSLPNPLATPLGITLGRKIPNFTSKTHTEYDGVPDPNTLERLLIFRFTNCPCTLLTFFL